MMRKIERTTSMSADPSNSFVHTLNQMLLLSSCLSLLHWRVWWMRFILAEIETSSATVYYCSIGGGVVLFLCIQALLYSHFLSLPLLSRLFIVICETHKQLNSQLLIFAAYHCFSSHVRTHSFLRWCKYFLARQKWWIYNLLLRSTILSIWT